MRNLSTLPSDEAYRDDAYNELIRRQLQQRGINIQKYTQPPVEVDEDAAQEIRQIWSPDPNNIPQQAAYRSKATIIGYGGAAGGGKTDFMLGMALTRHTRAIVFRREYPQLNAIIERATEIIGSAQGLNRNAGRWRHSPGKLLEFGSIPHDVDKKKYQGQPHDMYGFDEAPQFLRSQIEYVTTWLRTTIEGQACRVILTFNPPQSPDEEWIVDYFAPWVDPDYAGPGGRAKSGEIRYAVVTEVRPGVYKDIWCTSPEPFEHDGKMVTPQSRTFYSARVEDNRFMMATGYDKTLDMLPEELRKKMREGIISRDIKDHPLQILPRAWVKAAMERWKKFHAEGGELQIPLTQTGMDVSRGGADRTCLVKRYGNYFTEVSSYQGEVTDDGAKTAALAVKHSDGIAPIAVDVINVGTSTFDHLRDNDLPAIPMNSGERSTRKDRTGKFGFANKRAEWWWTFMEALDPDHGDGLMLPDDPELLKELTSVRYKLTAQGIRVELKEEIKSRLGGESPDKAEALLLAFADLTDQTNKLSARLFKRAMEGARTGATAAREKQQGTSEPKGEPGGYKPPDLFRRRNK